MSEAATKEDVEQILDVLHEFMKQVDERFNELDKKYDRLLNTIDGFISRIDKYETELAARDRQFERLLDWAQKVSKKTGIPLENL